MYGVRTLTEEGVLPSPVKVRGKAHFVSGVLSTMVVFWVGSGDGSETSGADARQPGAPHSLRDGGRVGCIADDSARGAQNGMAPLTVTGTEPKSPVSSSGVVALGNRH